MATALATFEFDLITQAVMLAIRAHAAREYPRECCGLIVDDAGTQTYYAARNLAAGAEHFVLDPEDWAHAEDNFTIRCVVHSHPDESANPSMADRVMCERSGLPWLIIGWPNGALRWCMPDGFRAPLIGREFAHGTLDCYSIVRDYYGWEMGIEIPDFERRDGWWETDDELYLRNFEAAGFVEVQDLQPHDGILMQVLSNRVNHAAVYLGENIMLHHLYGRLSCRDVYGGYWQRHTRKIVRHRSLVSAAVEVTHAA